MYPSEFGSPSLDSALIKQLTICD